MKRGTMSTVTIIIITIVGFLILLPIIMTLLRGADAAEIEATCRGSVAARGFQGGAASSTFGLTPGTPLLCETQHVVMPEVPEVSEDPLLRKAAVKKDIGDHIVRAWTMFGQGLVENPFLQSTFSDQNCFMAYTFTIDPKQLKNGETIGMADLYTFLLKEAYDAPPINRPCSNGGGKCVADVTECVAPMSDAKTLPSPCGAPHEKVCCTASSECENKGGRCAQGCVSGEVSYLDYSCRGRAGFGGTQRCCISSANIRTFMDMVESSGGPGAIVLPNAETGFSFNNKGQYGIMFVGSKENCGTGCKVASGVSALVGLGTFGVLGGSAGGAIGYSLSKESPGSQSIMVGELSNLEEVCPGGIVRGVYG